MSPFSFAIILTRKRELIAFISLSFGCLVTINDLGLFLMVPCVGLQFVIVVFPDHTHLLSNIIKSHRSAGLTPKIRAFIKGCNII